MMKLSRPTRKYFQFAGVLMAILLWNACSKDKLAEPMMANCETAAPTYNLEVKPIIDATCAYSGCHLDSSPGNFSTYDGMLFYLENNTFRERVIIVRGDETVGMPPNYAPDDRQMDLTDEQLNIIECWLDAGYPE